MLLRGEAHLALIPFDAPPQATYGREISVVADYTTSRMLPSGIGSTLQQPGDRERLPGHAGRRDMMQRWSHISGLFGSLVLVFFGLTIPSTAGQKSSISL